jgi:hypothetical protein
MRSFTRWQILGSLVLGLATVAAGCGSDSKTKPDSAVLTPTDSAPADVATHSPDTTAPDASVIDAPAVDAATQGTDATTEDGQDALPAVDSKAPTADTSSGDGGPGVACTSLVNPIFVLSGDTQVPILRQVGKKLRAMADPTTVVWVATGSCSIIDTLYSGGKITATGSYIPDDPSWDAKSGAVPTCSMPTGGVAPDLGIPIVFPDACNKTTPPATLGAIKGPVQSFLFAVPTASMATAISAEEAYLVFGFGAAGGVEPWTNEDYYFIRPASKGTQVSLGAVIGVPAAKWKGQRIDKSTDVASGTASAKAPDQAIGILGTEIYDSAANRAVLRTLTFQALSQNLGTLPDSVATAFDKRNVRDGHYVAWSHVFYMTTVDAAGAPSKASVKTLVDVFTGGPGATAAGINTVALAASNGLVPICAMTVQRSIEGGNLSAVAPASPCGCAYEDSVGKAPAACVACTDDSTCTGGARCSYGYCEAANGRTSLADCTAPGADHASVINATCTGRTTSPKRPMPTLQTQNGGKLPALP